MAMACDRSPHPGYKAVADGVHLRMITLGEGEDLVADGDSVMMRFRAAVPGEEPGSLFSTDRWYGASDLRTGALVPVLERLHVGDSISVIARARAFPWPVVAGDTVPPPPDTLLVQMELTLLAIRTSAMQAAERERLRSMDPMGYEQRLIAAYLEHDSVERVRWGTSDLHYRIEGEAADTNRVAHGEVVTIRYTGRRLEDGQVFDDTHRNGQAFTFRFGDHDQVIKGVETAVHLLREGQRGIFIIPSAMAFGERGIQGIIGPYTPVVYEVELERIERGSTALSPPRR